ncbi:hypothetical protein E3N88_23272 [Mikania micrantha]|uniref:Cytochrome P450 n=1 Tax=Mikania micrantha TaxID=192012 RepID=A0A5N6NCU3_9ASTR|nr:hypothetical protein E3N88_23272 [Mikania micrantha]
MESEEEAMRLLKEEDHSKEESKQNEDDVEDKEEDGPALDMIDFLPSSTLPPTPPLPSSLGVIFVLVKWFSFDSKNGKNIPPSPRKLPIIGNFHLLGSSPNRSLQTLSQKHGPIMLLHLGSIPTLVASSSEVAQEIMKTHDLSFCSRPSLTIPNIVLYGSRVIAFSPYGEHWRRLKSIMVLKLLSTTRVKSYQYVIESEIDHMIWVLGERYGTTIDMGATLLSLTIFSVGSYIPWLSWIDQINGLIGRAEKIAKDFDEFLEGVIEEHVNKKKCEDANSSEGEDFVDILLDLQNDETTGITLDRDYLKTLILEAFLGGTETNQTSLQWALSELIKNPRVMRKLQQEVTEVAQGRPKISEDDLEKMPYLKAVLKESLRLHPPVPLLVTRIAMQDVKLMGYDIAAGTQLIINAWAIGRDPVVWEEPYEFRPERFLNSSLDYHGFQFGWHPFGGGRRTCPGIQFSALVMELALANIVYKFDMVLPDGIKNEDLDMTDSFGITMQRKSPLLVSVISRF